MNEDPTVNRLREIAWRRALTPVEEVELRAWLAAHPEAQAAWENEIELSRVMSGLPDAPVPSNFTALVLQEAGRQSAAGERLPAGSPAWWWRVLAPRAVVAALITVLGIFAYRSVQERRAAKRLHLISEIVRAEPTPSPQALEDLEVIASLSVKPEADEELLALMQ